MLCCGGRRLTAHVSCIRCYSPSKSPTGVFLCSFSPVWTVYNVVNKTPRWPKWPTWTREGGGALHCVLTMVLFITQFICRAVKFNYFWSALHVFPHFQLTNVTFSGFNLFTLKRIISQTILNNVFALIIMLKLTGCHSNRHRSACWVIRLCVWTMGDSTDTFIRCHAISAERTNLTVELQITRAHLAQFTLISPQKWSQITW